MEHIKEFLDLAKSYGVKSLKIDGFEVVMPDQPVIIQAVDPEEQAKALKDAMSSPANEDEVLMWSAGGAQQQNVDGTPFIPPLVGEQDGD